MKKIVIKRKVQLREIYIWLVLFIFSFFLNILAIIIYDASWWEILSEIHYVLILSVILYFGILLIRAVIKLIRIFMHKIRMNEK
ncbi:MAG TPA: hypothetical protein PLZ15_01175 [Melioribacteraceae bacterium]|nr:hypothetical protein [Melioribacteraceae bacterium]